jgi:hypothetical protein
LEKEKADIIQAHDDEIANITKDLRAKCKEQEIKIIQLENDLEDIREKSSQEIKVKDELSRRDRQLIKDLQLELRMVKELVWNPRLKHKARERHVEKEKARVHVSSAIPRRHSNTGRNDV